MLELIGKVFVNDGLLSFIVLGSSLIFYSSKFLSSDVKEINNSEINKFL